MYKKHYFGNNLQAEEQLPGSLCGQKHASSIELT